MPPSEGNSTSNETFSESEIWDSYNTNHKTAEIFRVSIISHIKFHIPAAEAPQEKNYFNEKINNLDFYRTCRTFPTEPKMCIIYSFTFLY